jgi:hypothetical protein
MVYDTSNEEQQLSGIRKERSAESLDSWKQTNIKRFSTKSSNLLKLIKTRRQETRKKRDGDIFGRDLVKGADLVHKDLVLPRSTHRLSLIMWIWDLTFHAPCMNMSLKPCTLGSRWLHSLRNCVSSEKVSPDSYNPWNLGRPFSQMQKLCRSRNPGFFWLKQSTKTFRSSLRYRPFFHKPTMLSKLTLFLHQNWQAYLVWDCGRDTSRTSAHSKKRSAEECEPNMEAAMS